jgi:hypothetical protein
MPLRTCRTPPELAVGRHRYTATVHSELRSFPLSSLLCTVWSSIPCRAHSRKHVEALHGVSLSGLMLFARRWPCHFGGPVHAPRAGAMTEGALAALQSRPMGQPRDCGPLTKLHPATVHAGLHGNTAQSP